MTIFIENKAVEMIERSRVIASIKKLIEDRYETVDNISGCAEEDIIISFQDQLMTILKEDFPLEFQIAADQLEVNYLQLEQVS